MFGVSSLRHLYNLSLQKCLCNINKTTPCNASAYKGLYEMFVLEAGLEPARRLNAKGF